MLWKVQVIWNYSFLNVICRKSRFQTYIHFLKFKHHKLLVFRPLNLLNQFRNSQVSCIFSYSVMEGRVRRASSATRRILLLVRSRRDVLFLLSLRREWAIVSLTMVFVLTSVAAKVRQKCLVIKFVNANKTWPRDAPSVEDKDKEDSRQAHRTRHSRNSGKLSILWSVVFISSWTNIMDIKKGRRIWDGVNSSENTLWLFLND